MEVGQEVHVTGGKLYETVNAGVRQDYAEGYLRKSVVGDPLLRKNTGDNRLEVEKFLVIVGLDYGLPKYCQYYLFLWLLPFTNTK
ncbi:Fe-S hydro-lyase, tartrate dehydratase alpha-type, catalytic domain [Moorella glycerini]|uniref:Fumarate hydratase n=1 Tax=Neomoorella stamsii TaxID=1266720 RepID=A0A9X7P6D3_9FIRM|nr:fumarate hydratase [Moorella stamsii]CEP69171.1 Fe-S hydro-lyase, tartrate dehydratase alpha-type, catalytic domain [Moorella glycerini]